MEVFLFFILCEFHSVLVTLFILHYQVFSISFYVKVVL